MMGQNNHIILKNSTTVAKINNLRKDTMNITPDKIV